MRMTSLAWMCSGAWAAMALSMSLSSSMRSLTPSITSCFLSQVSPPPVLLVLVVVVDLTGLVSLSIERRDERGSLP